MLHKDLVGKNSSFGKAIHSLSDFNNSMDIVNKRGGIVLFHDVVGDVIGRYAHVFIAVYGCANIFFELVVMNRAPGVDIVLLRRNLTVMRSAVLVLISLG